MIQDARYEDVAYQTSPVSWRVERLAIRPTGTVTVGLVAYVVNSGGGWWVNPTTFGHWPSRKRWSSAEEAVRKGRWLKVARWVELVTA